MSSSVLHRVYFRTVRIIGGLITTAVVGINTLPHIFPQKVLLNPAQLSCGSFDVKEEHLKLLEETCKQMGMDSNDVQLFYTNGFSTHSAGSTLLPNKTIIGLPRNAAFTSFDDVKKVNINFQDKPIDWESSIGKAMLEVLIFNDKEIKFLLGHELAHIKKKDFLLTTTHAAGCCYGFYKLGVYLPSLLKHSRPLISIVLMNSIIWLSGVKVYIATKEKLSHHFEYTADEVSARLGIDYCQGGIEYMRNRLKLNRILRKLNGDDGELMFSKVGNNLQDTMTHPKRTSRLKKLKTILLEQHDFVDGNFSIA